MSGAVMRVLFIFAAFVSVFLFPYPFTVFLSFLASVFVPWIGIAVGLLSDALFFVARDDGFPIATALGAAVSLVALIVRRFIKARIM